MRTGDIAGCLQDLEFTIKDHLNDIKKKDFNTAIRDLDESLNVLPKQTQELIRTSIRDYYSTYWTEVEEENMRKEYQEVLHS